MQLAFVIGTARRGGFNHHQVAGSTFIAEAETVERMTLASSGDRAVIIALSVSGDRTPGPTTIKGELYEVDDWTMYRLDRLQDDCRRERMPTCGRNCCELSSGPD